MKHITLFSMALLGATAAMAQNGPIDFEPGGQGAAWTWTVFENGSNTTLEIVPNPDPTGINPSSTVAKFTALQTGNPWAGCETLHGAGTGSFSITAANAQIRIMVWKSVISDVGIKLVRPDGWSLGEIKIPNTVVNQWEQITFDFSAHIGLSPAYDQVVIFPDFRGRSADEVIYFDNVFGAAAGSVGLEELGQKGSKLYPNPGNGLLTLESSSLIESVRVYPITGQIVYQSSIQAFSTSLDLQHLPLGMYVVEVRALEGPEYLRYLKQ